MYRRLLCLILLLYVSSPFAFSQAQRDSEAVALLNRCATALGSFSAIGALHESKVEGVLEKVSADGASTTTHRFTWTLSGEEFRKELSDSSNSGAFVSGHGKPWLLHNGNTSRLNYHVARAALPFYLPGLVLLDELQHLNYAVTLVGPTTVGNRTTIHLHTSDDSDKVGSIVTAQEWFLDAATLLPVKVEYRLPSNENAADFQPATVEFAAFKSVAGSSTPTQLTYYEENRLTAVVQIDSVKIISGSSPSDFDLPGGGDIQ